MKRISHVLAGLLILAGCATTSPRPSGTAYTGEVWNWDEANGTVTLRRHTEVIRVRVADRSQLRHLRLHQEATVIGEPDGPAEIEHAVVPMTLGGPSGPADEMEANGTVSTFSAGIMKIQTPSGPVDVWSAQSGATMFKAGDAVRLKVRVQPLTLVPAQPGQAPTPAAPAAPTPTEPGEYAAVRGRVVGVDGSRITVESPRGPIVVAVPTAGRYTVGTPVEVVTSVHPAR